MTSPLMDTLPPRPVPEPVVKSSDRMSRHSLPLLPPPGLPARPTFDSYRPPSPSPSTNRYRDRRSPEPHYRDNNTYELRDNGYSSRSDSRVPRRRSRSPVRYNPSLSATFGGDSYRPTSAGFTFRMEAPPSLDLSRMSDSYRPPPANNDRFEHTTGNARTHSHKYSHMDRARNDQLLRPRGGFSRKAAERPFLQSTRAPTPELMPGMDADAVAHVKYLALEDLSDSEEADMDVSSDDEKETDTKSEEGPRMKHARTVLKNSSDGDSVPKWSNPDPYTALPPVDDSQRKKLDVVKLIRKARVTNSLDSTSKKEVVVDDFISFDFKDVDQTEGLEAEVGQGVPGAPTGPRSYSHFEAARMTDSPVPKAPRKIEPPLPKHEHNVDARKPDIQIKLDTSSNPALGSRKRTNLDEIKEARSPRKRGPGTAITGAPVAEEWRVVPGVFEAPWCTVDHAASKNMGEWLHMEIMDFYHHFKATEFEDTVRCDLVTELRAVVRRRYPEAEVHPFGSFVAGLYLPTADMDVVFCSAQFLAGGSPIFHNKRFLFMFRDFLISEGLARRETVEVISRAKVPLVKYVDRRTSLRVDISFENDTGLIANKTFKTWKAEQPAMPVLVTLIKQFLSMRRLNEPVNGGIGGFTVTCLVMSLLQLMPQVRSGNMLPEHHLGEVLMEFLDLYGNEFNYKTTAIQLNPAAYVPKSDTHTAVYKDGMNKLCIIDPNNNRNDIAGGSKNTPTIVKTFSDAYEDLQRKVRELHTLPIEQRRGRSMLSAILGGNYSSFYDQRERLRMCYQSMAES